MKIALTAFILLTQISILSSQQSALIPAWVFDNNYYNKSEYAIGISDPDLDSVTAFEQAKLRALINNRIFNNCLYSSLTSVAMANVQESNNDATNIESILYTNIIKGSFEIPDSINIEKKEFTQYGECCVLINTNQLNNLNTNNSTFSIIRRTGFQKENNLFPVFIDEIELIALNDSLEMKYIVNRASRKFKIKSSLKIKNTTNKLILKNMYRNYTQVKDIEKETETSFYTSLSSGLWAAYLFQLSDQISFNSILNKNNANQLITLEQGNSVTEDEVVSANNFILSSKNLEKEPLKISINEISIKANHIKISLKQNTKLKTDLKHTVLHRADKKRLKKLIREDWNVMGFTDLKSAFLSLKSHEMSNEYISGTSLIETSNIDNGLLKALQISRTEIENQLKSQINSQAKLESENQGNTLSVQTSKTIITEKTKKIEPYFIFYRKINKYYYQLQVILFYKI